MDFRCFQRVLKETTGIKLVKYSDRYFIIQLSRVNFSYSNESNSNNNTNNNENKQKRWKLLPEGLP